LTCGKAAPAAVAGDLETASGEYVIAAPAKRTLHRGSSSTNTFKRSIAEVAPVQSIAMRVSTLS
jgi:hypothetical protein